MRIIEVTIKATKDMARDKLKIRRIHAAYTACAPGPDLFHLRIIEKNRITRLAFPDTMQPDKGLWNALTKAIEIPKADIKVIKPQS